MKIKEIKQKQTRYKMVVTERELDLIETALGMARHDLDLDSKSRNAMSDLWGQM